MAKFIEITNNNNFKVVLCSTGASICDIIAPDRLGNLESVVITPIDRNKFPGSDSFFGKTIGRTGGRIANNKFSINGNNYTIISNDPNGLHGGKETLGYKEFEVTQSEDVNDYIVDFYYMSADMESGYPGNANIHVIYKVGKNKNYLSITYNVTTDKDTLFNLSNHAYFNLSGNIKDKVFDHKLYLNASKMERVKELLPREIVECDKIYSFKNEHRVGDYLFDPEIINNTNGYDYPYIFDNEGISYKNATLTDELSGRVMNVYTTYPVVVIYTCNYCEDIIINNNKKLTPYDAICLECMYHPNTVNSDFLTEKKDILRVNQKYDETIIFEFEVK